jgi:hypothetical protein
MASQHIYNAPLPAAKSVASATQTLIQLATPATRCAWILDFAVSGQSVVTSDIPFLVYFIKQTTLGTQSATVTPQAIRDGHPASLCTVNITYTVEPANSGTFVRGPWRVTPVGGLFDLAAPLGFECEVAPSSRIGLVVVTGQTSLIDANVLFAE